MTSRIEQFEAILRKDENLGLTAQQRHHVATLLAFFGCGLPLPVWTTREELDTAKAETVVVDAEGTLWEHHGTVGRPWASPANEHYWTGDMVVLPVQVRWLP